MSQLKVDSIVPRNGISSGQGGGIIQVHTKNVGSRTTITNFSNTSFQDLAGFNVEINLTSNTSKVLIMIMLNVSHTSNGSCIPGRVIRRVGGSDTAVNVGDSNGSRLRGSFGYSQSSIPANSMVFVGVDSPATTSTINYVLQLGSQGGQNVTINGTTSGNANNAGVNQAQFSSSFTVMEVCT